MAAEKQSSSFKCVHNCSKREKKNELKAVYEGGRANKFTRHMQFYLMKTHAERRHCYLYHPCSRPTCLGGFTVREQDLVTVPWPWRCVAERLSCRDDIIFNPPHLWLIGLRFHFWAETMDYWVWRSVSNRPRHLILLLYWSIWRSHHWLNHTDPAVVHQCSLVQCLLSTMHSCSALCQKGPEFAYLQGISLVYMASTEPHQSLKTCVMVCLPSLHTHQNTRTL